jgi:NAD(P)-dependent dehydrogenase (short-subunit alcohol dehydrogenase family)
MVRGLDHLPALIATQPHLGPIFTNALPLRLIEAADVSNAVLFLASDESRYVTGLEPNVA